MRKALKVFIWIAGTCLALALVSVIGLWTMLDSACANDVLAELPSPDGKNKALVFQRDCGATTGYSTQVSVLRSEQALGGDSGNVFVGDTNHGAAPSDPGGGPSLQVHWVGPEALVVSHHPAVRVFAAEPESGSVRITYRVSE
ncbi:MAG TPA: hypothetical protein VIT90_11145 [Lysobacter sp.]